VTRRSRDKGVGPVVDQRTGKLATRRWQPTRPPRPGLFHVGRREGNERRLNFDMHALKGIDLSEGPSARVRWTRVRGRSRAAARAALCSSVAAEKWQLQIDSVFRGSGEPRRRICAPTSNFGKILPEDGGLVCSRRALKRTRRGGRGGKTMRQFIALAISGVFVTAGGGHQEAAASLSQTSR